MNVWMCVYMCVCAQKVLPVVESNEWVLLGYNTTLAIILLLPVTVLFGELSVVAAVRSPACVYVGGHWYSFAERHNSKPGS